MSRKLKRKILFSSGTQAKIEAGKDDSAIPTFEMLAYTGGPMKVSGWYLPVIIDLAGMSLGGKNQPILKDHDTGQIVGHATNIKKVDNQILVQGVCSGAGSARNEVVASSSNGFPWQASVGADVNKVIELEEGKTMTVNGIEVEGPMYVARKSRLYEVSFVALGADKDTSAKVAAEAVEDIDVTIIGEKEMTEEEKKAIEARKAEEKRIADEEKAQMEAKKAEAEKDATEKGIAAMRKEQARIAQINAACKDYPEVAEKAIADGLSIDATKAKILDVIQARNASEVNASYVNTGAGSAKVDAEVLTVAAAMHTGSVRTSTLEKDHEEKVLDAADKLRNLTLKGMMELCARNEGKHISASMATDDELVQASFSTVSLPNMLSNLATKSLQDAFNELPSAAALLAEVLNTTTFHEYTGVKLGGVGLMEKVQNGGQIKSGDMDEETFNYKVSTVAKLIGITREMLVNDDLGGFTRIASNLGKSAYKTRENDFWSLVLANTDDFFGSGNSNYLTDELSSAGLAAGEKLLMEQTGIDGTPCNMMARWLVVPPALKQTARGLYYSPSLTGGTTLTTEANTLQGEFEPVVTPYLSNSNVNANASDTGWYLFSESNKPFGIAYLRGNQTPVVQEVSLQAGYLGRVWQGYYDYGTCQIEHRGGVFSTGDGS